MVATLVRYKNSTMSVIFYEGDQTETCSVSFFEQMDDSQYNKFILCHPYTQFRKIRLDDRYPYLFFHKLRTFFPDKVRQKVIDYLGVRDIYRNHIIDGII